MPLIPADNHFAAFAAIMVISGLAFLLERTRLGAQLTGAVLAILLAIAAANLGVIPHDAPAYDFIFRYVVPTLIPLFLFQADLRRLAREASRTTVAFLLATLGTVAGVLVAATLLDLSQLGTASEVSASSREGAIAGLFASTYIGGSVNYAALGEITGLNADASFFSAATAADNLFSAVYLSLLAIIPGWRWLARRFPSHRERSVEADVSTPASAASLCLGLAAAVSLVAISDTLVAVLEAPNWRYVVLTAMTLILATAVPRAREWFAGAFELGVALSFGFFAAIAAGANIPAMLAVAPMLIALVGILLTVHAMVVFGLGSVLRLSLPELITASNAAILGATTAPALAATKGWRDQVTPGVLVGVLGYALGTFIGTAIFEWWP